MQRCAAVEMLILNRPVPPASDSVPMNATKVLQQGAHPGALLLQASRSTPLARKVDGVAGKLVQMSNKLFNPGTHAMEYQSAAKPHANALSAVSDVTLLSGGMRVHAHKSILSAQSVKFARLLSMSPKEVALADIPLQGLKKYTLLLPLLLMVEVLYLTLVQIVFALMQFVPHGKGRVLRVRDLPYDVLLVLLQYMYNCLEEIDEDMLMDMFKASQVYGIAALHQDCLRHLQDMMDTKTVVRFAHLAEECKDSSLYSACVQYCATKWNEVVHSPAYINLLKVFPHEAKKLAHDVQSFMVSRQTSLRAGAQPTY